MSEKCRKNVGKEQNDLKDDPIDDLKELTERQTIILELIAIDPTISAKAISEKISEKISERISERISEKIDVTDRTIENDLAQLKKMGILVREGGRKGGRWIIKQPTKLIL